MPLSFVPDGPVTLHRNVPWDDLFAHHTGFLDGPVYMATYSFNPQVLSDWARVLPLFQLTLASGPGGRGDRYRQSAFALVKQHPLCDLRIADQLHTKAVFFAGTGKLYVGSQNLYSRTEQFDETIVELSVPVADRAAVIAEVFESIAAERVRPIHEMTDVYIYEGGPLAGFPHLLSDRTVQYWDIASPSRRVEVRDGKFVPIQGNPFEPSRLYHLAVYEHAGRTTVLAFNGGYVFSGDVSLEAYEWLIANCEIRNWYEPHDNGYWVGALRDSSPWKDDILRLHPATQHGPPIRGVFLDRVRNPGQFANMLRPYPNIDLDGRMLERDE